MKSLKGLGNNKNFSCIYFTYEALKTRLHQNTP